ncbi:MAG: adenylate/guanylate cyclase domain-containing protein, partial [Longimicrobiales bacterium]
MRARRDRDRQRAVLDREIGRHGGRIVQVYGDGALSVFDSAIEAVASAVAIQRELDRDPRVALRVGIHTGDVVYDNEGVFGDGVNVASRIQSLGTPGSVLVSAKVYDEIKNQPQLSAVSLGEFNLKNVQRPVEVFGIAAEGLSVPSPESLPSRAVRSRRSVAVLPFLNMSADPDNEFFSDGVAEEPINVLARATDRLRGRAPRPGRVRRDVQAPGIRGATEAGRGGHFGQQPRVERSSPGSTLLGADRTLWPDAHRAREAGVRRLAFSLRLIVQGQVITDRLERTHHRWAKCPTPGY